MFAQEKINLKKYSSMKIGGDVQYFFDIRGEKELEEVNIFAKNKKLPIFPLGGGTNTIFSDGNHEKILTLIKIAGITKLYENENFVNVKVGAGENWDRFVEWSVKNGLSGIEALSGIPGTVGAGPIQNIGAYGQEIAENLIWLEVFDLEDGKFYEMSNKQCEFSYRESIFKKNLGKFIITNVAFQLYKKEPEIPQYKDVQLYFLGKNKDSANVSEIREAILEIRKNKLPDPKKIPNCGSFFKNPLISEDSLNKLLEKFTEIPHFKVKDNLIKIYAGWLIEQAGYKNKEIGLIKIYEKNALVITNPDGKGSFKDLENTFSEIQNKVSVKFGIKLEIEPNIIR